MQTAATSFEMPSMTSETSLLSSLPAAFSPMPNTMISSSAKLAAPPAATQIARRELLMRDSSQSWALTTLRYWPMMTKPLEDLAREDRRDLHREGEHDESREVRARAL